jgi:glycosyltransferase involved in cell wall biosynthesis
MNPVSVSILIPTRNRAEYLAAAVHSALAQDLPGIEVIVSDNASTDATQRVLAGIADPRLRTVRQEEDLGMVGNWNACLALATGEFVLVLSDDDELLPHAIRSLAYAMEPGRSLAYGLVDIIDAAGRFLRRSLPGPACEGGADFIRGRLAWGGRREPYLCALMMRRSEVVKLGKFPAIGNLTDLAVEVRLCAHGGGEVVCVRETVAKYRTHPGALSWDPLKAISGFAALRDHLLDDAAVPAEAVRHYADVGTRMFLLGRRMIARIGSRQALADLRTATPCLSRWSWSIALAASILPLPLLDLVRWCMKRRSS